MCYNCDIKDCDYMKIVYNKNYEFKSQITDNEIKKFIDNYKENIGWMDINKLREPVLIEKLKEEAINIRKNCDIFLVVGIGGSYIGSKAIIDALNPYFKVNNPQIILQIPFCLSLLQFHQD